MKKVPNKIFSLLNDVNEYHDGASHKFFLFLRENRTLISILTCNYIELKKVIQYHNSQDPKSKLWSSDPNFRFRLQKKIIRHVSNYLSSVFTVVDYSRNTIKTYLKNNPDNFKIYETFKANNFINNPLHRFIQDLRNYASHNTYIKIGSQISYSLEWEGSKKAIFISKADLLSWGSWSAPSMSFIKTQSDKINIFDCLQEHYEYFIKFQELIYHLIITTDLTTFENFLLDLETIFGKTSKENLSYLLIFKESYFRYIKYAHRKALRTTMHLQNTGLDNETSATATWRQ